ncbi:unnamed protein product [Paramecium primaurelia]|uniref:Uncharacterized protein n=1 Tax=Paramecium primaurelia TaxID=5886 RepID=A0A8S1JYW1_PARPR|nr:unnamed protein product [Paramecium primaurelia]
MSKVQQQQPSIINGINQKVEEIVEFINNPAIEKIPDVITYIQQLSNMKYQLQIEYSTSKFCAFSGIYFNENNKDDIIYHDGYYFLASQVKEYYRRGEYYDISIGDLEFEYYNGITNITVQIELTEEFLNKIFKNQVQQVLKKFEEYYQNQEQPIEFICQKTKKIYYISDRIKFNDQDVSIYWAIENVNLLDEVQRQYILEYKKMLSQISLCY